MSRVYTSIQSRTVLQNTLLLGCVLFVLFFFAGWAMPRILSLRIDINHIFQNLLPVSTGVGIPDEAEEASMDILIL